MSIHARPALTGLVVLAAALAGCGEDPGVAIGYPNDPVAGEYVGDGPARVFPEGSEPIRLALRAGEVSFTAGCNHFSGRATWDDGVLRTGALGGTEMGCPGSRQQQDEWMGDFFGSSPMLELDGTDLAVRSGNEEVWFVPADEVETSAPGDATDLVGTEWRLTGIGEYHGDAGSVSSIPQDVVATIRFADGETTFSTGCNDGGGTATIGAGTITFGELAQTLVGCNGARGEVERSVTRVLRGGSTVDWSIHGNILRLRTRDGRHELVYQR